MKEIKFRAWTNAGMIRTPSATTYCLERFFGYLDKVVDGPAEIMQFTGLKDKNGVEIYEGDLLDFELAEWGGHEFLPEIITIEKLITGDFCGTLLDISEWREVIGNIYENPELLIK